jgi:hypothetical protein
MSAIESCGERFGVRLIAFGRQMPHTALHWHSDGRNFALTAHLPLAGPGKVCGARTPPFGGPAPQFPPPSAREGAAWMMLAPLQTSVEDFSSPENAVARAWSAPQSAEAPGKAVVFDTSFLHCAYNDGDVPADILFIDFFHPELSAAEADSIRTFQQMLREADAFETTEAGE